MSDLDYRREVRGYLIGFCLALILTLISFALLIWGSLGYFTTLIILGIVALAQIVVHLRFFLHIDLSRQKREDLQLILFSTLLLVMMSIGTVWIMGNLATRM